MLARLMVRAEDKTNRLKLLEVIRNTQEQACLRLLLDYHGLQLLWSWMVDLEDIDLKSEIIKVLEFLPIPNKTMLKDSKVYDVIEKWSIDKDSESKTVDTNQEIKTIEDKKSSDVRQEEEKLIEDKKLTNGDVNLMEIELKSTAELKQENVKDDEISNDKATEDSNTTSSFNELKSSLHKGFNIIKKDSKSSQDQQQQQQQQQQQRSIPNIGMQATRLLNLWKDLKEVYRIPRLERQKRHEDEKEADRKAMENEENNNNSKMLNTPAFLRKNLKRPFDSTNKFGGYKQGNMFYTQYSQNAQFNHPNSNQNAPTNASSANECSLANKISKEEHRTYYNVELMRKDYEEAMKQYKKQVEQYNAAIQQQLNNLNNLNGLTIQPIQPIQPPMPPAPPNIYQTTHQLSQSSTPSPLSALNQFNSLFGDKQQQQQQQQQQHTLTELKNTTPVYATTSVTNQNVTNDQQHYLQYSQPTADYSLNQSNYAQQHQEYPQQELVTYNHLMNYEQQTTDEHIEPDNESQSQELEKSWNTLYVELTSGLNGKSRKTNYTELTNDQHKLNESDSLRPDYYLDPTTTDDDSSHSIDNLFITSGTYFVSEGKTYFIPSNSNGLNEQPLVIESRSELPSKELSKRELPENWNYSTDKNGYYYYYNKVTNQVQWNVPSNDKTTESINSNDENNIVISNATSDGTAKIDNFDLSSIDQATLTEIMKQFNGNDLSNLNSLTNIDLDPRKRTTTKLLSSVDQDTQESNATSNNSLSIELENKIIKFPYQQQQQQQQQQQMKPLSERKIKERFKSNLSEHIKNCLNPYRRADCKGGRILCIDDFKYLCRKVCI